MRVRPFEGTFEAYRAVESAGSGVDSNAKGDGNERGKGSELHLVQGKECTVKRGETNVRSEGMTLFCFPRRAMGRSLY